MANGNGSSLSRAWEHVDEKTKLDLAVNELDRIYGRIDKLGVDSTQDHSLIRQEFTKVIAEVKVDFVTRIDSLRTEMRDGFEKQEKRSSRSIGLMYTMIGGIVVGLVIAVVNLAPH